MHSDGPCHRSWCQTPVGLWCQTPCVATAFSPTVVVSDTLRARLQLLCGQNANINVEFLPHRNLRNSHLSPEYGAERWRIVRGRGRPARHAMAEDDAPQQEIYNGEGWASSRPSLPRDRRAGEGGAKENNLDNGEKQLGFCARQPPRAIGMADTKKRVLKTLFYKLLMLFPISSSCLTPWPGVTALVSDTLRCDGALAVGHGVRYPSEFATTVRTGYQLQCRILAASQSRSNCLLPEYGAER